MDRLRICFVLFAFAVIAARAEETNMPTTAGAAGNAAPSGVTSNTLPASITVDGTTYEEVRWQRVTPTTVTIFHKTGVATIPLDRLPTELQKRFGFNPDKAAQYQQGQAQAQAERTRELEEQRRQAANIQKAIQVICDVQSVLPAGILAQQAIYVSSGYADIPPHVAKYVTIFVVGYPRSRSVAVDETLNFDGYRDGTTNLDGVVVERWVYVKDISP